MKKIKTYISHPPEETTFPQTRLVKENLVPDFLSFPHRKLASDLTFLHSQSLLKDPHWGGCAKNVMRAFPDIASFADINCGAALLAGVLAERGLKAFGTNYDPDIVKWNRKNHLPCVQSFPWQLPCSVDMIFCFNVLEYIPLDYLEFVLEEFAGKADKYICVSIAMALVCDNKFADSSQDALIERSLFIFQDRKWWLDLLLNNLRNWREFVPPIVLAPWSTDKPNNIFLRRK